MTLAAVVKKNPWIPFLVLALIAQQANMMTYKFGGEVSLPYVFLAYCFMFQAIINIGLVLFFKTKGFPLVLKNKMRVWLAFVSVLYLANEMLFISTYRSGAPYSMLMVVFSCSSLFLLTCFGLLALKEKLHVKQVVGLFLAVVSIVLIRME